MENNCKLSIVVPCYNEEESIPLFYKEVNTILSSMGLNSASEVEYVFIDDGSKDKTCEILKSLAQEDERVKFVSFSRNFGKEAAMFAGLEKSSGEFTVMLDADLQHPPMLIPQMFEIIQSEDVDCVEARRTTRTNEPWLRSFLSCQFYKFLNKLSEVPIENGSGDFRMMNRAYVESILSLKERNRFSKGIFPWIGYKTRILEFENVERVAGTTKWSFKNLFAYSMDGILGFSSKPLLFSAVTGVISMFISFIIIIALIVRKLVYNNSIEGWASLVCIILFIAGVQLFSTGIIGLYLSKMYEEIKNRPIYIKREEK